MFYNLEAEMLKKQVTRQELADSLDITYQTFNNKITGKTSFKLEEMLLIKKILKSKSSLDTLFKVKEIKK